MARKISVGLDLPAPADLVKSLDDVSGLPSTAPTSRTHSTVRGGKICRLARCRIVLASQAVASGFDYVAAPLFHPRFRRDADGISDAREGPGTRESMRAGRATSAELRG